MRFNITGPCVPGRDLMVDLSERLKKPLLHLRRGESLVLTKARQHGKTTFLRHLSLALQKEGFAAVLCSLQFAEDQSLLGLLRQIEMTLQKAYPLPALPKWVPQEPQSTSFCYWLTEAQRILGKRLILLLDEFDSPPRKLVSALLRSFRSAMTLAEEGRPFVHALVLCGKTNLRELREEVRPSMEESRGSGSLFNVAIPFLLPPWSQAEVSSLIAAYCADRGVVFDKEAEGRVFAKTRGQPFLTSRLLYLLDDQLHGDGDMGQGGAARQVSASVVESACMQILDEPESEGHLHSIADTLSGRKEAQELVLRILSGDEVAYFRSSEPISYLLDAGILVPSEARRYVELANPIYATFLGRWLAERT